MDQQAIGGVAFWCRNHPHRRRDRPPESGEWVWVESVVPSKVRGRIDDHRRPVPAATKRRRHDSSVTPAVLQVDDGHVSGVCGWGRTYGLPTIEGAVWGSARVPTVGDSKNRASSSSALELERGKKVTASPRAWRYAIPRDERAPAAPVHSSIWPAA
jgi:hypothetical protein